MKPITGSCHCGAVAFQAEVDLSNGATRCNCNICQRTGSTSIIIKPDQFKLVRGKERLVTYSRFPEIGSRYFCGTCGIHVYGEGNIPELGGAFVSVNANCFGDVDPNALTIKYWDGRHDNWQAGMRDTPWPTNGAERVSA